MPRVHLKSPELTDVDLMLEIENNQEWWRHSDTTEPIEKKDLIEFVYECQELKTHLQQRFIIVYRNTSVGTLDLYDFDIKNDNAWVGIAVKKGFQRLGIGTAALQELIRISSKELNIRNLLVKVAASNLESNRLFKKVGCKEIGVIKSYFNLGTEIDDLVLYQKVIQ